MLTKFICLANSFKEGGRCLAGIELDESNNPVIINGRPKWVRPVCETPHGEVPNQIAEPFQILNIIQLEVIANRPQGYQAENITFRENSMRSIGNFNSNQLANLCDNRRLIFGNKGKAVPQESIINLNHSLLLVSTSEFEITQRIYEDRPSRPKTRLIFKYNGNQYDFPITDPVFLHQYHGSPDMLENINRLYLSLSLAVEWENWCYKLVAGIVPDRNALAQNNAEIIDDLPF
jgi:hypothetical protein